MWLCDFGSTHTLHMWVVWSMFFRFLALAQSLFFSALSSHLVSRCILCSKFVSMYLAFWCSHRVGTVHAYLVFIMRRRFFSRLVHYLLFPSYFIEFYIQNSYTTMWSECKVRRKKNSRAQYTAKEIKSRRMIGGKKKRKTHTCRTKTEEEEDEAKRGRKENNAI